MRRGAARSAADVDLQRHREGAPLPRRVPALKRIEADVAILGAGPAGAAAALALAGAHRVVLLDRDAAPADRIGETLPAAARRLLGALGLWEGFLEDGHSLCHARRSVWGGGEPITLDAMCDPDGPGWRLDRRRFEARLRAAAADRGALLLAPAHASRVERAGEGWRIEAGEAWIEAQLLIDASGRGARPLRAHAGAPVSADRLICAWLHAPLREEAAEITYTESAQDGWWYSAPLPDGRRLIAFHTDSDLARGGGASFPLVERALATPALAEAVADADLGEGGPDAAVRGPWRPAGQRRRARLAGGRRCRDELRPALLAGPVPRPLHRNEKRRGGGAHAGGRRRGRPRLRRVARAGLGGLFNSTAPFITGWSAAGPPRPSGAGASARMQSTHAPPARSAAARG